MNSSSDTTLNRDLIARICADSSPGVIPVTPSEFLGLT
jgi:hypothetical protein